MYRADSNPNGMDLIDLQDAIDLAHRLGFADESRVTADSDLQENIRSLSIRGFVNYGDSDDEEPS